MKKFAEYIIILHIYQKSQSYDVRFWATEWDRPNFLSFWTIFCPFSHLKTWKIKILKLKKTPGDIIILHICTVNDNHMMYGSWYMERDGQNFLSFWTVFYPFTSLKAGANASNISSNILVWMLDECWMKIRMLHEIKFCIWVASSNTFHPT